MLWPSCSQWTATPGHIGTDGGGAAGGGGGARGGAHWESQQTEWSCVGLCVAMLGL